MGWVLLPYDLSNFMGDAMNERLKELAVQAGLKIEEDGEAWVFMTHISFFEKFAELVRQDEREACAKLCDDFAKTQMVPVKDTWRMGVMAAANAVRDKK